MTNRVLVFGLAILLLAALIWTGCTPTGDIEETSMSATMAIASEPNTLDPQTASASVETSMLPLLYDTLVYRTPDNTYQPFLAESWEIDEDGTAITFTLRE